MEISTCLSKMGKAVVTRVSTFFSTQPICATYKRGENLVWADFKQPTFKNEEFSNSVSLSRNVEASIKSRFDQEHKLPEENFRSSQT